VGMIAAVLLERIAYRPLRNAPRLVPLISAIGASLFIENAAQLVFGSARHTYANPAMLERNTGWKLLVNGQEVMFTYTGVLTFVLSILLMVGLRLLVQRTKMGKAMRAVAEDRDAAALMGIDVNRVIANTFAISGILAGAAGVMWGLHNGIIYHYVGFIPGIKAFTSAVLGGIGNVPGAMLGGSGASRVGDALPIEGCTGLFHPDLGAHLSAYGHLGRSIVREKDVSVCSS
jgi:branched-chain amino acid transport system permease protein